MNTTIGHRPTDGESAPEEFRARRSRRARKAGGWVPIIRAHWQDLAADLSLPPDERHALYELLLLADHRTGTVARITVTALAEHLGYATPDATPGALGNARRRVRAVLGRLEARELIACSFPRGHAGHVDLAGTWAQLIHNGADVAADAPPARAPGARTYARQTRERPAPSSPYASAGTRTPNPHGASAPVQSPLVASLEGGAGKQQQPEPGPAPTPPPEPPAPGAHPDVVDLASRRAPTAEPEHAPADPPAPPPPTPSSSAGDELDAAVIAAVPAELRSALSTPRAQDRLAPALARLAGRRWTADDLRRRLSAEQYPPTVRNPAALLAGILDRIALEPTPVEQRTEAARAHARGWLHLYASPADLFAELADRTEYQHDPDALAAIADELGIDREHAAA